MSSAHVDNELFAERILVGEDLLRHCFVYEVFARRLDAVVRHVDQASSFQGNRHRAEEVGVDDAYFGSKLLPRRERGRPTTEKPVPAPGPLKGSHTIPLGRFDAGDLLQPFDGLGEERDIVLTRGRAVWRNVKCKDVRRIEARIDGNHAGEALEHEAGSDEEDQAEGGFRNDQDPAKAISSMRAGTTPGVFERGTDVFARGGERGCEPKQNASGHSCRDAVCNGSPVEFGGA